MPKTNKPLVMLDPLVPKLRPKDIQGPCLGRRRLQDTAVSVGNVERAYESAESCLRSMLGHVRALFEGHAFLSFADEWLDGLESALDEIHALYRAGELPICRAAPGDEYYDGLKYTLDSRPWESNLVSPLGADEEKEVFIYQTVDFWLGELRSQGFAFLSFLDGSVPAFDVLDSLDHASHVGYPVTTF